MRFHTARDLTNNNQNKNFEHKDIINKIVSFCKNGVNSAYYHPIIEIGYDKDTPLVSEIIKHETVYAKIHPTYYACCVTAKLIDVCTAIENALKTLTICPGCVDSVKVKTVMEHVELLKMAVAKFRISSIATEITWIIPEGPGRIYPNIDIPDFVIIHDGKENKGLKGM